MDSNPLQPAPIVPNPIDHPREEATMSSLLPTEPEPEPGTDADPVATARRVFLMRRLVVGAVHRYRQALAFTEEIDAAIPAAFNPPFEGGVEQEDECQSWRLLLCEAENDFYSAEAALGERIFNLYDFIAPEDRRVGWTVGSIFQERGVEIGGTIYLLTGDPAECEPGKNTVVMARHDRVINLNG
jgi:hypothetical protein